MTVVETGRDTLSTTICSGMEYTWRGKVYTQAGCYRDTLRMLDVKQSYIHTLLLDISDPIHITSAKIEENICADTESFDIVFSFLGGTPTSYTIRFDELAKKAGFVDIIDAPFDQSLKAHVALPQFKTTVYQNHNAYVQPNYYSLRVELDNGICGIERTDSIEMLIRYPSWIIEQNWADIVMPLKAEYNGGFEFVKTDWYINHVLQPTTGIGYLQNANLSPGDEVEMWAVRKGENVAIPTCAIVIREFDHKTHETPVIIYPTQVPRMRAKVKVKTQEAGEYALYSATGFFLSSGKLYSGENEVTLPASSGIYFIRTKQGNEVTSHKVLIY